MTYRFGLARHADYESWKAWFYIAEITPPGLYFTAERRAGMVTAMMQGLQDAEVV